MAQTDTPPTTTTTHVDARAGRVARAFARRGDPGARAPAGINRRLLSILLPVTVAGAGVTAAAAWSFVASDPSGDTIAGLLALLLAASAAEAFPLPIERVPVGRTSLATVFIVGAATIYGWAGATLIAVVTMGFVELAVRRPPARAVAYNVALYALSAAAAGATASILVGSSLTSMALGTLAAACAFYVVDIGLLAAVVSRSTRAPIAELLRGVVAWTALPLAVMASLTIILVVLWQRSPLLAVALVGPLVAVDLYERWLHGSLSRLRELDRLKDEFMAVVSHELRTPLASVYGAAVTLQRRELDREGRDAMLSIVYRESARLAQLVDQVLWASRLESGRDKTTIESLDAEELAREVVDSARSHLPPGLSLDLRADTPTRLVAADSEKLEHVLVNLVENAVKYSPDGGRIEVRLEPADGHLRVTVADEGLGIPPEEQDRIFDKFKRLDPHLTRGVGGTGLGLYICREMVQQMGGRIWVVSEPAKGSAFSFELPWADAA
ncbi:MAG TPA: HAMP domain-containing sensor histidine kinase [Gaiellaceae bacterium]|nr:HAMP domain-containing sensor histidine kinase [Gaiellaceae bacterium]